MNKRELQNFAVWAKENLENQIKVSLNLMGIYSDKNIKRAFIQGDITVIEGETKTYPKSFKASRDSIVRIVKDEGYENVIEQFAYTWFNRIVSLRFMEVHGYLDHGFKIFPDGGTIEPEILSNLHFIKDDLNLDSAYYTKLKEEDNIEELYRYILFKQCNSLSKTLPMLFSNEYQYLEYLLPTVLLTGETIITRIVELDKENFLNDVEVIGWLYQFYISSKKDEVFASKEKITKDTLPAVTQLFTPDWIVKYMAENSIGRIWLESYPTSPLRNDMKYYVDEAEQTAEVEKELEKIRYKNVNPEDIKIIEPAAGSGHILVYAFDLLLKMYEERGYLTRDIPSLILKNNLVGLDVDKRASQLAQFALMIKARSVDPRFFIDDRRVIPKVFEIKDSKKLYNLEYKNNLKELVENDWKKSEYNLTENDLKVIDYVADTFKDAKVIGSLLKVKPSKGYLVVGDKINKLRKTTVGGVFTNEFVLYGLKRLSELLRLAHFMSLKYDVMITNPPYIGISKFEEPIKKYANKFYADSKADMFAMFMETGYVKNNGYLSMINMQSWMFLKSFEKLRKYVISNNTVINLLHLGAHAFEEISGEVVQTCTFILKNYKLKKFISVFYDLQSFDAIAKQNLFLSKKANKHYKSIESFFHIPGFNFSYWLNEKEIENFKHANLRTNSLNISEGIKTGNNERFIKKWWEINSCEIYPFKKSKYVFHHMGGLTRKWYGNKTEVIYWENDGELVKIQKNSGIQGSNMFFKKVISYGKSGSNFSARVYENQLFDSATPTILPIKNFNYILGLLNSKISIYYKQILNPSLSFQVGDVGNIPVIFGEDVDQIEKKVIEAVQIATEDWNLRETSFEFEKHPLIGKGLKKDFGIYKMNQKLTFNKLKKIEEDINDYFINLYSINEIIHSEVEDKNILVSSVNVNDETKSLISYLIGVLMGRYSLVEEGLIYAGGEFDNTRYGNYELDDDGIIPIYSKLGMEDGLTAKIISLIKQIYGEETYKENIDFIAEGLGKKQNETSEETLNRYLNDEFYKDHLKTYQKRPIYWMFSSGKDNGFKALIYLHRYNEDTLARINSNYLLPETTRLRTELNDLENGIKSSDAITQRRLEKERDIVNKQYYEAIEYGLVLDHMANRYIKLDLDDGVKVNYAKFQNVEIVNERGSKIKKDLLIPIK
ncbi:MAG: BREX-1 system adenine-specific DNA-methyltransferase PglX [Acholeplasmataceae bacterium]|nr:BREX-1 system adenine-specific DNA-methyltransferase PglX [Acholeplasmataceae bacterium]